MCCTFVYSSFKAAAALNLHLAGEEDRADFVLVSEYIMADALHARGIIKAMMPSTSRRTARTTRPSSRSVLPLEMRQDWQTYPPTVTVCPLNVAVYPLPSKCDYLSS